MRGVTDEDATDGVCVRGEAGGGSVESSSPGVAGPKRDHGHFGGGAVRASSGVRSTSVAGVLSKTVDAAQNGACPTHTPVVMADSGSGETVGAAPAMICEIVN